MAQRLDDPRIHHARGAAAAAFLQQAEVRDSLYPHSRAAGALLDLALSHVASALESRGTDITEVWGREPEGDPQEAEPDGASLGPWSSLSLRLSALQHLPAFSLGGAGEKQPGFAQARDLCATAACLRAQSTSDEYLRAVGIGMLAEAAARNPEATIPTAQWGSQVDVCGDPVDQENQAGNMKASQAGAVWVRSALQAAEEHLAEPPQWLDTLHKISKMQAQEANFAPSMVRDAGGFPNPVVSQRNAVLRLWQVARTD